MADQKSAAASAQGDIVQVIAAAARPGSEAQYIEGRKRHMEWHRAQKDPWAWHTYNVLSGPATGMLVTVSAPHKWADRDGREQFFRDDQADVQRNIAPYAMNPDVSYWRARPDMSRAGAPKPSDPPAPYYTVTHFVLNADATGTYADNIKRISAALDKANSPGARGLWYQLVNGGEGPRFALVTARKSWAEMEGPPVDDLLRQAIGAEGATLLGNARKQVKKTWTELLQHNNELSYHPAGTTR